MVRGVANFLLMAVALACSIPAGGSQSAANPLRPGDTFPVFSAQTLTGKTLVLPSTTTGEPAVVVFSFSRAGG